MLIPKPPKITAKQRAYGKKWMAMVKMLPCAVCGKPPPSDVHHIIHDKYSQKRSLDTETIPLCKSHHQHGADAIHNGKETWRKKYGADHEYLHYVYARLGQPEY